MRSLRLVTLADLSTGVGSVLFVGCTVYGEPACNGLAVAISDSVRRQHDLHDMRAGICQ